MWSTPEILTHNPVLAVKEAFQDWQQAERYFDEVTEPSLIDFAIFWERAARLRYQYLLRCLKLQGFSLSTNELMRLVIR